VLCGAARHLAEYSTVRWNPGLTESTFILSRCFFVAIQTCLIYFCVVFVVFEWLRGINYPCCLAWHLFAIDHAIAIA
jgi:hypothetical protein